MSRALDILAGAIVGSFALVILSAFLSAGGWQTVVLLAAVVVLVWAFIRLADLMSA
jgi:hypothetical protein